MDDLDAIKSDPGVLAIYGKYVGLKKAGNLYTGRCPLHSDSTPSFSIYPDMRWTCFSGCGSGNIFQLIERLDSVSFQQAVERVKQEIGSSWSETKAKVDSTFKSVVENKVYKTIPLSSWGKAEAALVNSKEAVHYLDSERGISLATAQKLRFGFVQSIGGRAHDDNKDIADKGWMLFPCIEEDKIVSIKFRSLVRKKPGGFIKETGMATALFNTNSIDVFETVYLVEGEYDVAVLEQAGFCAVSLASASAYPTPEQKDQLMKSSQIMLAGDNDGGVGNKIMDKLWRDLGNQSYRLIWPEGCKDANDAFLKNCGRDVEKFKALVLELTSKAKSQPTPDIYSIQEILQNGEDKSLADRADRLRFPWTDVDQMAILLPGSVLGLTSTNTSMGKTPFALQFSLFGARKYNEVVVNWQCELSPSEIAVMVAAQILHKNRNFLTKEDQKKAAQDLEGIQYYVGNNPSITDIMSVLDLMEAAIRRTGATVAILDNLHYYTTGIDDENRVQTAAIKRIKQMAGQYGLKFGVVGQPRKASAQSKGKKTHITDAKGSGSFGDTCDAFMAIHRDLNKDEGKNDIYEEKVLVEMLKTRSKGIGKASCFLHFFGEFASFEAIENNYPEGEPE